MADQPNKESPPGEPSPPEADALRKEVAERDLRLRDLTEQALGLMDRLAEERRKRGTQQLRHRIEKLEELLADARRRLRHAGGRLLGVREGSAKAHLDVVLWTPPGWTREHDVESLLAAVPEARVLWVGRQEDAPSARPDSDRFQIVTRPACRTPAQIWNTAMACTDAPAVFFLSPGAGPSGEPLRELPDALRDPVVGMAQPVITANGGTWSGVEWDECLDLRRVAGAEESVTETPGVGPEAFLLSRAAFETVGPFDQELASTLALVEMALRMHRFELRNLGWSGWSVTLGQEDDLFTDDLPGAERDRLVVVARHQPEHLGRALAESPLPWELSGQERSRLIHALHLRHPDLADHPGRDILEATLDGLIRSTLPPPEIRRRMVDIARPLEAVLNGEEEWLPPEFVDRCRKGIEAVEACGAEPPGRMMAAVEALGGLAEELVVAWRKRDRSRDGQLEQARRSKEQLQRERDEARAERDRLAEQLRQSEARHREALQDIQTLARAVDLMGTSETGKIRQSILEMKRELHAAHEQLTKFAAVMDRPEEEASERILQALVDLRAEHVRTRNLLAEREKWIAALLTELSSTRFKIRRRRLLEHEEDFLRRVRQQS